VIPTPAPPRGRSLKDGHRRTVTSIATKNLSARSDTERQAQAIEMSENLENPFHVSSGGGTGNVSQT
jgi:hypothetical protein